LYKIKTLLEILTGGKIMKRNALTRLIPVILLIFALTLICGFSVSGKEKFSDDTVKNFVAKATFYSPVKYKNLTIIPVKAPYSASKGLISTFDEAVAEGSLTIKEVNSSGSVNQLAVINKSDDAVYIMAGEILRGSKQDRVLQDDVLIPANSGKILVDCFCVEQGRWTYKSDKFYSGGQNANISVRQAAKEKKNQSEVWDSVATTNSKFDQAPSGSLAKSFESEKVNKDKAGYISQMTNIPEKHPDANGVVVLINGKVLVADLFSDPRIFKKLWKKLSDSYAVEAISQQDSVTESSYTSAQSFLSKVQSAKISYTVNPGLGRKVEITSGEITGSGLVSNNTLVHIDLFPKMAKTDPPTDNRLQRNYQQRNQINAPGNVE
jgi:hypothetical protein